jgi:hypothetical protein
MPRSRQTCNERAATAHIADISCSTGTDGESYEWVTCSHPGPDTHQYRAWIHCTNGATHTGSWYYVNSGSRSWAYCSANTFEVSRGYDITPAT